MSFSSQSKLYILKAEFDGGDKMRLLNDDTLLNQYLERYALTDLFEASMQSYMSLYQYDKGELVCKVSQELNRLYFLVEGKLRIYTLLPDGRPLLLRFNKPLSVLGDLEYLNRYKVRCNVETVTSSVLIGLSFDDLYAHAYNDPKLLRFLLRNLSHKLYTICNAATINLLVPAENRLASYLLSTNSDEHDHLFANEIKCTNLTEIATLLGMSYRHLNRIVSKFAENGIITRGQGTITITDFAKLALLAKDTLYE
jgi:cAMP-binding proteins - catabolite gene activator and regulatory subunit of cAMP-dependent protein kinases